MDTIMDIVGFVFAVCFVAVVFYLLGWLWLILLMFISMPITGWLFNNGHEVLAFLVFIVFAAIGLSTLPYGGSFDTEGKGRVYDNDGNVRGYFDKD